MMNVAEFMTTCIGMGIVSRWLTGWTIAGMRFIYSMVDSVTR